MNSSTWTKVPFGRFLLLNHLLGWARLSLLYIAQRCPKNINFKINSPLSVESGEYQPKVMIGESEIRPHNSKDVRCRIAKLPRAQGSNIICSSGRVNSLAVSVAKGKSGQTCSKTFHIFTSACHTHLQMKAQKKRSRHLCIQGSKYAPWLASMHWVNTPR